MVALAIESLFVGLAADALSPERMVYWEACGLMAASFLPGLWLFFSLSYARGNYRQFLAKWKPVLVAAFLAPLGLVATSYSQLLVLVPGTGPEQKWTVHMGTSGTVLNVFILLGAVVVLMNLERTFRASVGTMRWRIKFMIIGLGILFAARAYTSSQALLFRAWDLSFQEVNSGALLIGSLLVLRSLLRQGHFNLDVYPSQSVLHNSLTVLLAGIYLFLVGVFAKVVAFLGGDTFFAVKAFLVLIALVLLTMLLLSDRARLRTRQFVSRHFQRSLYDYRTLWRRVTQATASRVRHEELCQAALRLSTDIFQALSVSIWTVDDKNQNLVFAASTFLSPARALELQPETGAVGELIEAFGQRAEPVDLDASKTEWAAALRRSHPDEFRKGGNRVCVPMMVGSDFLGVILLGDRVSGVPFTTQDFDLLKCVGDQLAASLLNIQLSHRLMQGHEMEAFQTMSAFFVHDLKNTASTLSLMLQNLPGNFNDPAFREDAMRGISKTVSHINDLISRLGLLRKELGIQPVSADLNAVVTEALANLAGAPRVELIKDLQPLPSTHLDPLQIQSVVTNLVLNAQDALPEGGQIRVATSQRNGWLILAVSDTGCGMKPEFVQRNLFRPFQTTKKKGIGIGMFQSKMIVEAHRGRIEVQSEVGKGTSFRVLLPVQGAMPASAPKC